MPFTLFWQDYFLVTNSNLLWKMSRYEAYNYEEEDSYGGGDYNNGRRGEPSYKRSYPRSQGGGNYHGAKKQRRDDESEMRILIPTNTAGGIIGKKGENIKDMRQTFSALIQLPDGDINERVLLVRSSAESCGEIILRILPIINEDERHQTLRLLVHQSQAGGIIGMKGFKIKELREKTGADIKVHQDCCPRSTDRVCVVSGSPEVVSSCVVLILKILENIPPLGAVENYDPALNYGSNSFDDFGGRDRFSMGRGGRRGSDGGRGGRGRGRGQRRGGFGRGGFREDRDRY